MGRRGDGEMGDGKKPTGRGRFSQYTIEGPSRTCPFDWASPMGIP